MCTHLEKGISFNLSECGFRRVLRFEGWCRENRGKSDHGGADKKPAVIAAMRKLLTILNAKMRDHLAEPHISPETAPCTA